MSKELLVALNAEAISQMSPYELADRAVALRMGEHNALGVEPIETEDGKVLYTVTSGLVTPDYNMSTSLDVRESTIVRQQTAEHPFTLFADVVELQPPQGRSKGQARLMRVEEPLAPILASAEGPFREVVDAAILATGEEAHRRGVSFRNGFVHLRQWDDLPDDGVTHYGHYPGSTQKLGPTEETELITKEVGDNKLNKEVGVEASYRGLVRIGLSAGFVTRVTSNQILMGPTYDKRVELTIPEGEPQSPQGCSIIPEGTEIVIDNGRAELRGPGSQDDKYKYSVKQPELTNARIRELASDEALGVEDVTTEIIRSLAQQLAGALPFDAKGAYDQTATKAREEIRVAILAGLSPVPGGVGCLAVAARMAELPDHPNGYVVDEAYFSKAS